jgi:small basic protein (TIGR04137 family)
MSKHKSLKRDKFKDKRNVRTRRERLAKLIRTEKFVQGMSVYGLPKEKITRIQLKIKKEKKELTTNNLVSLVTPTDEKRKKKTSRDDTDTRRR